jgi:hypothetical protein
VRDLLLDGGRAHRRFARLLSLRGGLGVHFPDDVGDPLPLLVWGQMLPTGERRERRTPRGVTWHPRRVLFAEPSICLFDIVHCVDVLQAVV